MKNVLDAKTESGFSVMEMLVSICILIPVMGAAVGLFSLGASQHSTEQTSIESTQEARAAFEMMTTEIAQAGAHGDVATTISVAFGANAAAQPVRVASTVGFAVGDYVDVDTGSDHELVQLTAVGGDTITGVFRTSHQQNKPVRLFALPYATGVLSNGLAPNSTRTSSSICFYGDILGNSTVQYVEYNYNAGTNQITRSITPITQNTPSAAVVLVNNIKPNSAQFTINTDSRGIVTSAVVAMTVQNTVKSGGKYQETELASRITIPSAIAASALLYENYRFGGFNHIPPTPENVTQWASR